MKKILRIIGMMLIAVIGTVCFAACGEEKKPYVADNTEHYDAITKTLKLQKTYEGKDFYTDGIGKATVAQFTDGDTTLFNLANTTTSATVNIRYYAIDTPESTGGVEKWGKAASNFTKQQLESATEIVLEATATPAEKDGYGTRYLGYVWYKTADYGEFKCLNLEIVENGYSENRGQNTSAYPYNNYFVKANDFAMSIKLRIYSALADPLYNDDPIDITIKDFIENTGLYYNEEDGSGSKVRFTAYLKSLTISGSGTYTFVAEEYDASTGKTYSVNVYTGYSNATASVMAIGHLYHIVGNVQKYGSGYQISGLDYSALYPSDSNTHIEQRNYYWTFNNSASATNNTVTLYSDVTVKSVDVDGTVMTIVGTAQKYSASGYGADVEFTFKVNVDAGYTPTLAIGDIFTTNAYKFDTASDDLTIISVNNIIKK